VPLMADQGMGPERLTPKGLPSARRGYDHKAVERLLEEAQRAWTALEQEHRRLLDEIDREGGLDYLARDLGEVSGDVRRLLGDAQEAARGLRERARADSAERLEAAEVEARRLLIEAEEQAFHLRADAWAAGMDLLRQAAEMGREMVREAGVEVLSIRAGAEQEAHRLVVGARRESQDLLREARFAAERAALEARTAAEYMLSPAPVTPEPPAAAESPAEPPETGRRRRHAFRAPTPVPDVIRVIQPTEGPRAAARPGIDPGSYGDALAAEVEALWESGETGALPPTPEPAATPKRRERAPVAEAPEPKAIVPEPAAVPVVEQARPTAEAEEPRPEQGKAPAGEPAAEAAAEAPAPDRPAEAEAGAEGASPTQPPSPEEAKTATSEATPEVVEDLFSRLRGTHRSTGPGGSRRRGRGASPLGETLPGLGPAPAGALSTARGSAPDAIELRERLVLPVQNRALRRVKENLLELQNSALDALRVSGTWEGAGPVLAALGPALDPVAEEGAEAGAQAAAAFVGGEPSAPVITSRSAALVQAMADELDAQVGAALTETSEAGPLETAAAVSRVFRAWRAEEAEHWVRTVAYAAYHDSLLAGLAVGGVASVAPVAHGLLCPECPAFRGVAWDPAGEPPPGTARPPVHSDCVCTVAPSASP
jgi:hypothetical protein